MNNIEKQKTTLIAVGIILLALSIGLLAGGIVMLTSGIPAIADNNLVNGVVLVVFGIVSLVLFLPALGFGIYCTWIGFYTTATKGSIKQGNIAKEGGTVNMAKCDRCGTEKTEGQTHCSECGKEF